MENKISYMNFIQNRQKNNAKKHNVTLQNLKD